MPAKIYRVARSPALPHCPVEAVREEVQSLLVPPAITPGRRQNAEVFLRHCRDMAQLLHWQQLVLQECAKWEDEVLLAEEDQAQARPWQS